MLVSLGRRNFCTVSNAGGSTATNLERLFNLHTKKHKIPYFECRSGNIEILKDPIDFYITLHQGIRRSYQRICFSTLYVGTGNLEQYLVASISNKVKKSKKLKVTILMDYFRGTRMNRDKKTSKDIVAPLKTENIHNQNVSLAFYPNPDCPRIFSLDSEGGLREIFGAHHMKYYIFDDDVLVTGANLHESYFTERQDRYVLFKNVPHLANYLEDLTESISNGCMHLEDNGEISTVNYQPKWFDTKNFKEAHKHQLKMFNFTNRIEVPKKATFEEFFELWDDDDFKDKYTVSAKNPNKPDEEPKPAKKEEKPKEPSNENKEGVEKKDIKIDDSFFKKELKYQEQLDQVKAKAAQILQGTFDEYDAQAIVAKIESTLYQKDQNKGEIVEAGGKVYIFPTLQIASLGIRKDEEFFMELLKENAADPNNRIVVTTGYMSFIPKIREILLNAKAKIDLLTASPLANGFYNGGFFKGWIPYLYRVSEYKLIKEAKKRGKKDLFVHEYAKQHWTFHSKGIWIYEKGQDHPSLFSIGSTNFSSRSYNRDSELNLYVYSQCPKFKEQMHLEVARQLHHADNVTDKDLKKDPVAKLGFFSFFFHRFFKGFL